MATTTILAPAMELAAKNKTKFPNESKEYRQARNALLAEEIELRRHIERVAELRRTLPNGGAVLRDYSFDSETGNKSFVELFGDKETLVLYSFMFGPKRARPCPMCTAVLSSWDGAAPNVTQRVALAATARSPIERILDFKKERGWRNLALYSDSKGDFTRDYVSAEDGDVPALTVFTRRNGAIRHFWSAEMSMEMADPGEDPRGAPDLDPLWTIFDCTLDGRGSDWYPKLEYSQGTGNRS
ncbi:MAG TPA: DUF899 family protein [Bryobacteraceae bacterium]|nr:DUF899 family protein [Bryobacteraceae bacterium]